jgi:hypothetical protein
MQRSGTKAGLHDALCTYFRCLQLTESTLYERLSLQADESVELIEHLVLKNLQASVPHLDVFSVLANVMARPRCFSAPEIALAITLRLFH